MLFVLTHSVGPDAMPFFVTFHLGLHDLLKYSVRSDQYTKELGFVLQRVPYSYFAFLLSCVHCN